MYVFTYAAMKTDQPRRYFLCSLVLMHPLIGCMAMNNAIDHAVRIKNVGKTEVVNLTYTYSTLGPRKTPRLGAAGDSITKPMPIPDYIDVEWVTEVDSLHHEAHVPFASRVSASQVAGHTVSIEIDGASLKVFIVKRLPGFREEKHLLN